MGVGVNARGEKAARKVQGFRFQVLALRMRKFEELLVWKKGVEIATDCYALTANFPKAEKYGLVSQMTKAAVSIPSNIAEGCSRSSNRECRRFFEIALGSCFELETQLIISLKINIGDEVAVRELINRIKEEEKMLTSFISKISVN